MPRTNRFLFALALAGCGSLEAPDKAGADTGVTLPPVGSGTATGTATGGTATGSTGTATGTATGTTGSGTGTGTGGPETDCGNGADDDGDGLVDCLDPDCPACVEPSCAELLANNPALGSGVYSIEPVPGSGNLLTVYCDMSTDGGGWTLVASSLGTVNDANIAHHADLATLDPSGFNDGVWGGLREQFLPGGGLSDIRFMCTQSAGGSPVVDLSFYQNQWYVEITAGDDQQSCFNEGDGVGADPPPGRRNNLTGDVLPAGDPWNEGYLEGEDYCGDELDFSVDFDDRGIDGDEADGTDWGEDDGADKCGPGGGIGWFVFVR